MWPAEGKPSLASKTDREEAIGQVSDRSMCIFQQQPQRQYVIAAIFGAGSLEVFFFPKGMGRIRRTGTLTVDPQDPSSAGVVMLLRLFSSKAVRHFGYVAHQVPSGWTPPGMSEPLSQLQLLRGPRSERGSSVYSACLGAGGASASSSGRVVVKFSTDIEREVVLRTG